MKVNKIIAAKNPDGRINSITIMDPRHTTITMIMSTPEPNSEHGGWMRQLHNTIIDTEFRVSEPITVDITDIEAKYHQLWCTGKLDRVEYQNAALSRLIGDLVSRNKLDSDNESINQGTIQPVTEYAQLSHYLDATHTIPSRFKTFKTFAKSLNVKGLTYLIQHIDSREKYYAEYAMCVQYINDKDTNLHLTFNPLEFLNMIRDGRFIYCGELFASNCIRRLGEVNNQLATVVERKIYKIMQKITSPTPRDSRSLDAIFL